MPRATSEDAAEAAVLYIGKLVKATRKSHLRPSRSPIVGIVKRVWLDSDREISIKIETLDQGDRTVLLSWRDIEFA